ncbi:MAG: sulfotransferase [Cryomorphaceae bacterium]
MPMLSVLERLVPQRSGNIPLLLVIGPPRSGTTLIYQYISSCYNAAYISNLASVFPYFPGLISFVQGVFSRAERVSRFDSNFGLVRGFQGPSEAGLVMSVWFDKGMDTENISRSIRRISKEEDGLFVTKNVWNAFRISEISKLDMDVHVLLLRRDVYTNAASILSAESKGVSIVPKLAQALGKKPSGTFNSILHYLVDYYEQLDNELKIHGINASIVQYEDFCKSPKEVLESSLSSALSEKVVRNEDVIRDLTFEVNLMDEQEKIEKQASLDPELISRIEPYEYSL